jgi:bifunctional lysine-specific demethylase and histidyl-hydroxylase NO66
MRTVRMPTRTTPEYVVDAPSLSRLVGDAAGFLDTAWGRCPRHLPASGTRSGPAELLTLADVDELVASSGLRAPAFRLVEQGRTLPQASVTRRVRIGSRPVSDLVDVAAVHRAVADGATLVLQGLHRSFAPVAAFCRDLEATLTHPVQANAYLTPPIAQGLNLHEDPHDVFAVQTYGSKRWVVHPPGSAGSDEAWDLQLEPGDVLYLPAGTRHAAQTIGTPSLHLTLGVRTVTWRDVVTRLVDEVLHDHADLDEPLPAGWAAAPTTLGPQLTARIDQLRARFGTPPSLEAVLDRQATSFWSSRTPDLSGGLRDLLELDQLEDRTALRRRRSVTAHVTEMDGRAEVVLRDRVLRMPSALIPVLRHIVDGHTLRPADLEEFLDAPSRLVLCRRLVREGVLTVDRATDGLDESTVGPTGG